MELRSNIKLLNYTRKFLLNDTDGILPYDVRPQKPEATGKPPLPLPRCTPREAGVPAGALDTLLRDLSGKAGGTHTCLVLRHGKVLCEAEYAPYSLRRWHVTHSMCKSVTGTAIGMLIDEGLLSSDEHICDIFPEKCSLLTSRRMRAVTVRHLLSMRSGVGFREAGVVLESDWAKAFFDADVLFEPGETFDYNSLNSYMLSAIVQKKTGVGLMEYLRPRLFEPLGFGDIAWETCPQGIAKGGWGMYVYLEDLAKLGQLYLQKGVWTDADGAQHRILSEQWITAATSPYSVTDKGEEYGFQLWPYTPEGVFLFNGMFGQYVVIAPARQLIVAVNAGAGNLFVLSEAFAAISRFVRAVGDASAALPGGSSAALQGKNFPNLSKRGPGKSPAPLSDGFPSASSGGFSTVSSGSFPTALAGGSLAAPRDGSPAALRGSSPALPSDSDAEARLAFTLSHLRFAQPVPPYPTPERPSPLQRLRRALAPKQPRAAAEPAPSPIPQAVRGALEKSYSLEANRASMVPTIAACMEDWYSGGVERVAFELSGGSLTLLWHESGAVHRVPVGFDVPGGTGEGAGSGSPDTSGKNTVTNTPAAECTLDFGGNRFCVGTIGRFTTDEDDNPVLKLTVCFLESSSARLIKFVFLPDGTLTVKLDETPGLQTAMDSVRETMKAGAPSAELFKDMGYLQYLIRRACAPELHSTPEPSPEASARPKDK